MRVSSRFAPYHDVHPPTSLNCTENADLQLHVEEGKMTCRGCGHIYPIQNGIPNMVSRERRTSYGPPRTFTH